MVHDDEGCRSSGEQERVRRVRAGGLGPAGSRAGLEGSRQLPGPPLSTVCDAEVYPECPFLTFY